MLENITAIDQKIIALFTRDYLRRMSLLEMTKELDINYSHAFKRVNLMIRNHILNRSKKGMANEISINLANLDSIKLLSYIDEMKEYGNPSLKTIINDFTAEDPFACIGLFGSRVSGKATRKSDWDVFIITARKEDIERLATKFSYMANIQLQVFDIEEFRDSLLSQEETVVKHIVRNKRIIYNAHPFYNLVREWERIKYVPSQ
jgi:predicted nucleotidyltransferase